MDSDRLRELNDFLPRAEAAAAECRAVAEDAEELVRATRAAIAEEKKEHRHLRGLPLLFPAALVAAGEMGRWAAHNSRSIVTVGGVATAASAGTFALAVLVSPGDHPPASSRPALTAGAYPPPVSQPSAGRTPTPASSPKRSRPTAAAPTAPPVSSPPPVSALPSASPLDGAEPPPDKPGRSKPPKPPTTHKPPNTHKPTAPPGKPPKDPAPARVQQDCLLHVLRMGLVCAPPGPVGALPSMWLTGYIRHTL